MKNKKYIDWNQRLDEAAAECRKKCRCGHTVIVPYSSKYDYVLCGWCNGRVYRDDEKQKIHDAKVDKADFIYNLNKCIEKSKEKDMYTENHTHKRREINKKNLKKKYFKKNEDYFTFCNDMNVQIYIVNYTDSGKIEVYYGAKLGRPIVNKETQRKVYQKRRTKWDIPYTEGDAYEWRRSKKNKSRKSY